jgi:anti-sigma factor RsiW
LTVQCSEVREFADAFLSDQLLVETTHEIVHHLETCPACREELTARRALRARLQTAFAGAAELAPRSDFVDDLRARLHPHAPATISRRAWLQSWWAVAAGAVAAAGGGLFARGAVHRSRLAALARNAAGDHQNCAVRFNLAEQPISLEEAARRYDAAYASLAALEPPVGLPDGPIDVLERHSCVYQGRRFGHIVFRYRGRLVSLLVTGSTESIGTSPEMLPADDGLHVASFSSGRHLVFVVSDLSERDTSQVAEALAEPVARRLAGA